MLLKISVLASGAILADGKPADLPQVEQMLAAAKENKGTIWYYREAASGGPPHAAKSVLNLIVQNKLPISLSSKPDFSDWVDAKGVSHPRTASASAMPEVALVSDIESVFGDARKMATGEKGDRGLVIVRPDRKLLLLPALTASPELDAQAASLERLIPSATKRAIAVIADTSFALEKPSLATAGKSIPFFGNLLGLSYIGHAVWIFEGHSSALTAGCRGADVLFVDGGMVALLQQGWEDEASKFMRNPNILIQDRGTFKLRIVRRAGQSVERLEFPN